MNVLSRFAYRYISLFHIHKHFLFHKNFYFISGVNETICIHFPVPGLLEAAVSWYTRQGLRVLAVAGNTVDRHTWEQVICLSIMVV